jgi:hypothetical protein
MPHELERYYPGDAAWSNYVGVMSEAWPACGFQQSLLAELGGLTDIAQVVYALVGDDALRWIHSPAPALDGLSPLECLANADLARRLRSMLMRMPI